MADSEEVDVERHPSGGDCSLSTPVLTRQAVDGRNPGSGDEGPGGRPRFATIRLQDNNYYHQNAEVYEIAYCIRRISHSLHSKAQSQNEHQIY